jgi:hypothetical protein
VKGTGSKKKEEGEIEVKLYSREERQGKLKLVI